MRPLHTFLMLIGVIFIVSVVLTHGQVWELVLGGLVLLWVIADAIVLAINKDRR